MRKLFSGSSIFMLVCMIIAIAVVNAVAQTEREDGKENILTGKPWLAAMVAGVCVWFIDYFFDKRGRDVFSKFAQSHSDTILA